MIDLYTKKTNKVTTSMFSDVIDDATKPDTIVNIQNKYGLSFPFTVKLVKSVYYNISGDLLCTSGLIINVSCLYEMDNELYVAHPNNDGRGINAESSKKFILWE